ncbi:MAG: hypothetical protein OXC07_04680 [Kistimonas sp.]|nr:hypothetical protein [Kistimonas sp.]
MDDAKQISLSVTEDRLMADANGEYRCQLLEKLAAETRDLKAHRNSGLSPSSFSCADALVKAMEEAAKVVELTWHKHHQADTGPAAQV